MDPADEGEGRVGEGGDGSGAGGEGIKGGGEGVDDGGGMVRNQALFVGDIMLAGGGGEVEGLDVVHQALEGGLDVGGAGDSLFVGEVGGSLGGDLARDLRVEGKGEIDLLARLHRGRSGKL